MRLAFSITCTKFETTEKASNFLVRIISLYSLKRLFEFFASAIDEKIMFTFDDIYRKAGFYVGNPPS
ncbi:MAG: hypothetical protein WBF90_14315 [Rivularia sp. (in: cyanobacteria)]|jgi:hypothetical protein